ncbi:Protein CBG03964 [Caenorhabditis briggsae]|uniref:glucuronosyltransferase n=1 Tax=Caenorhabditis briggsae TaxID=6238 RepID=A8WVV2_CAEBR|nr:Protein CBG03964 [Caenorhabditis briggsae]CAP24765.2 Protein CBG03964 [Caenorhabditis briggsae]
MSTKLFLIFSFFFLSVNSVNVLVYSPAFAASHTNFMARLADTLTESGHNVTFLVPIIDVARRNQLGVRLTTDVLVVEQDDKARQEHIPFDESMEAYWTEETDSSNVEDSIKWFFDGMKVGCENFLRDKNVFDLMKSRNFDVAILEPLSVCGLGFFEKLGIEKTILASSCANYDYLFRHLGEPNEYSYVPSLMSTKGEKMNFFERFENYKVSEIRTISGNGPIRTKAELLPTPSSGCLVDGNFGTSCTILGYILGDTFQIEKNGDRKEITCILFFCKLYCRRLIAISRLTYLMPVVDVEKRDECIGVKLTKDLIIVEAGAEMLAQKTSDTSSDEIMEVFWKAEMDSSNSRDMFKWFSSDMKIACRNFISRRDIFSQMKSRNFDLAILEPVSVCGLGFVKALGIEKIILASSCTFFDTVLPYIGEPLDFSYVPAGFSVTGDVMSISERYENWLVTKISSGWEQILNKRTSNVLISFGSMVKSTHMPLKWSHGGLGSTMELAYSGKPAVVIPVFADQIRNANMLARHKGAIYLHKNFMENIEIVRKAFENVLFDQSYKKNALKLADILNNQPYSPKENVIKYTEFVGEHGPFPSMDPYGRHPNYFQKTFLDIYAIFALFCLTIIIFTLVVARIIYATIRNCFQSKLIKRN